MIYALDHIAIATADINASIAQFSEDLGLTLDGTEDVAQAKTSTAFFPISGTRIELVSPLKGEGPIATHLERRGPGLHHIAFATDNIDADMKRLLGKGYRFTSDAPVAGAHNSRVVFLHPKTTGGTLIELVEHQSHDE